MLWSYSIIGISFEKLATYLFSIKQALNLKNGHEYLYLFLLDCSVYKRGDRSPKVTTVSGEVI